MITLEQARTEMGTIMDSLIGQAHLEPTQATQGVMKTLEGLQRRIGDPRAVTLAYIQILNRSLRCPRARARWLSRMYLENALNKRLKEQ